MTQNPTPILWISKISGQATEPHFSINPKIGGGGKIAEHETDVGSDPRQVEQIVADDVDKRLDRSDLFDDLKDFPGHRLRSGAAIFRRAAPPL
jgi:hypothetical protein